MDHWALSHHQTGVHCERPHAHFGGVYQVSINQKSAVSIVWVCGDAIVSGQGLHYCPCCVSCLVIVWLCVGGQASAVLNGVIWVAGGFDGGYNLQSLEVRIGTSLVFQLLTNMLL